MCKCQKMSCGRLAKPPATVDGLPVASTSKSSHPDMFTLGSSSSKQPNKGKTESPVLSVAADGMFGAR